MLGLSISTVSRALKDHPDISDKTKLRVKELANALDYEPNANAINLRTSKNNLFGLIVPSISNFFYDSFIAAVEEECRKKNYSMLILQSGDDVFACHTIGVVAQVLHRSIGTVRRWERTRVLPGPLVRSDKGVQPRLYPIGLVRGLERIAIDQRLEHWPNLDADLREVQRATLEVLPSSVEVQHPGDVARWHLRAVRSRPC